MKEFKSSGIKQAFSHGKRLFRIRSVVCPFCREAMTYGEMWYYRKSNVGTCKQCGQRFRIQYSPLRFVIFFLLLAIAGVVGVLSFQNNGYTTVCLVMLALAAGFGVFYLVMPLTMKLKAIRGGTRTGVVDLNQTASMTPVRENSPAQRGVRNGR